MTDVDAITLSSARLFQLGRFGADEASKVVLIAALANLAFKGAIAAVVGGRQLGVRIGIPFVTALAVGAIVLAL